MRKIGILNLVKGIDMELNNTILIVDDSRDDLNLIKNKIVSFFENKEINYVIREYLQEDNQYINEESDIAFIDICMPINGFEVARNILKNSPNTKIVFCTSHNELVFDSFQVDLFGFVRKDHLDADIENVLVKYLDKTTYYTYKMNETIPLKKILYFEASHSYVLIHLMDEIKKERISLKNLEMQKHKTFCKISSSYIINMDYIREWEKENIIMSNGDVVYLSRSYKQQFKIAYAKYLLER